MILADLHEGSEVGLTPPKWWQRNKPENYKYQRKMWKTFSSWVKSFPKVDHLFLNGDAVDGKQKRRGGMDLITSDIREQCLMAASAIEVVQPKTLDIIRGTGYHVGNSLDYEDMLYDIVRKDIPTEVTDHGYFDINGMILDIKHQISNAQLPHTKGTPLGKERLNNLLWHEHGEVPKADLIVRSHVHNYHFMGGWKWAALTTPALQGLGGTYGVRMCSGVVDFGLILVEVTAAGEWSWQEYIAATKDPDEMVTVL